MEIVSYPCKEVLVHLPIFFGVLKKFLKYHEVSFNP
jgi:hypothetical protein